MCYWISVDDICKQADEMHRISSSMTIMSNVQMTAVFYAVKGVCWICAVALVSCRYCHRWNCMNVMYQACCQNYWAVMAVQCKVAVYIWTVCLMVMVLCLFAWYLDFVFVILRDIAVESNHMHCIAFGDYNHWDVVRLAFEVDTVCWRLSLRYCVL